MLRTKERQYFGVLLTLLILSASLTAQKKDKSKDKQETANLQGMVWQDLGDISSLISSTAPEGKLMRPMPTEASLSSRKMLKEPARSSKSKTIRGLSGK